WSSMSGASPSRLPESSTSAIWRTTAAICSSSEGPPLGEGRGRGVGTPGVSVGARSGLGIAVAARRAAVAAAPATSVASARRVAPGTQPDWESTASSAASNTQRLTPRHPRPSALRRHYRRTRTGQPGGRGAPGSAQVVAQTLGAAGVAQLAQRLGLDLADALAGHPELAPHFLQRPLAAVLQPEA